MDVEATASETAADLDESTPEALAIPPAVVAVVATRGAGAGLEDTLRSLGDQDYPALTVLVLDAGSDVDPTPRVASALPGAFVRRLGAVGPARAANEAMTAVVGASFLCFCHDDVMLEPDAVRLLVEESFRSNAAIAGPKVVDADEPRLLREVGWAIDRFGEPHSVVEPGEYDQEQHDGVREVFFVSSVAMLVRADLFRELQGFDADAHPGGEDLDLCWRAHLLGGRVMVVPDARVRHRGVAPDRPGGEGRDDRPIEQSRVRAFLKNVSTVSLLVWLPIALIASTFEALFLVFSRQREHTRASMGAWWGGAFHFGRVRRARKQVQRTRVVDDSELRYLCVAGSTRARRYLRRHLLGDDAMARFGEARDRAVDLGTRARRPLAVVAAFLAAVFVIGSRDLVFGRVRAVGSLVPWQGVGDLFGVFGSGWRGSGAGAAVLASPAFALAGTLSAVLLGADDLARTLVVVGAVPLGVVGVWRLVRALVGRGGTPAFAAAFAYLVTPVWRNAIAQGRLGAIVAFGVLPFVVTALVSAGRAEDRAARRRARLRAALLLAVATAFAPVSVVLVIVAALVLVACVPLLGGSTLARSFLRDALVAAALAVVLAAAWFATTLLAGVTPQALGAAFRPPAELADVARWSTGPVGAGWLPWGLVLAAVAPVLAAGGDRFRWAGRGVAWYLAAVLLAWVPSRLGSDVRWFAPEVFGTLGALGLSVAAAMGVAALADDLPRRRFGWRHVVTVTGVVVLVLPVLGYLADAGTGRWAQPANDWANELAWTQSAARRGEGRVLWIGDARVLPLDSVGRAAGTDYAFSDNGPAGVASLLPAPTGALEARVSRGLARVAAGRTTELATVLAQLGVRYVVVVERPAPGSGIVMPAPAALASGLDAQLGLAPQEAAGGVRVYENSAWVPVTAVRTPEGRDVPARSGGRVPAGVVSNATNPDAAWSASVDGRALAAVTTPRGNAWTAPTDGALELHYTHDWIGVLGAFVTAALWVALGALAFGRRPRRRPPGGATVVLPDDVVDVREPEPAR